MEHKQVYPRGSEWRQWDLHVHTPASFHWNGPKFETGNSTENTNLIDEMISAFNSAEPAVFALMDYWTFDGWFALKRRLAEPGSPSLHKTIFPGIELRLSAPTKCRLNAHVLFSDDASDQTLHDFKSSLQVEIISKPLSNACLIELARKVGEDKLRIHGFKKREVDSDDGIALLAGATIAEINCDSYKNAIAKVPDTKAIGFMPYDTSDGLAEVKWHEHYAYFLGLFRTSPIFESRNLDLRNAFVNEETPSNASWLKNFQAGLENTPRLVVSGSDAHRFKGTRGDNDRRGYGDFPSGKSTWIKADPTFQGLLQAIREPAKRSFIGERPPKLVEIDSNKTFYIDALVVEKLASGTSSGAWLDGCNLPLNPDLVAVIGNKGSGKSALADVVALLGNSRQIVHFSFLKKGRFRGKSGEPAKHFNGSLAWRDGSRGQRNLNEDPPADKVELVRYIPQDHFESLCNDHISGRSSLFERELRAVIFSHTDDSIRLGALDFEQLIEQQEIGFRDRLGELRKDLRKLNEDISSVEDQLQPDVRRSLQELLTLKRRQIDEHLKIRPIEKPKPTDELTSDQRATAATLDRIAASLREIDQRSIARATSSSIIARKQKSFQNINERLRLLEKSFGQFQKDISQDLEILGLQASELAVLTITLQSLEKVAAAFPADLEAITAASNVDAEKKVDLQSEEASLKAKLNAPQLAYQQSLEAFDEWAAKLNDLNGAPDSPDTLNGVEARIAQIDGLPEKLKGYTQLRLKLMGDIFDVLNEQRLARARLFQPVQDLIQRNSLIRDDYKLQFQANLSFSPDAISDSLFALIKQQSGEFRGGDESFSAVRNVADRFDCTLKDGLIGFVKELHEKIEKAAAGNNSPSFGIANALRKDKLSGEVYDLLFGLSFLEPRYTLLFQETQIEQLSPGQRGALLLIFYLLVDKGRNPIILDQPEENLDNQTVVSLLVPVLTEAKKKRQIIMVTHNPNLAVVCDAEQVIYSSFDRKGGPKILYTAGSIENTSINTFVIDVLEGTKPAFNNRRLKYH
jgi:ABC-type multidrug transport system ATPase subunit